MLQRVWKHHMFSPEIASPCVCFVRFASSKNIQLLFHMCCMRLANINNRMWILPKPNKRLLPLLRLSWEDIQILWQGWLRDVTGCRLGFCGWALRLCGVANRQKVVRGGGAWAGEQEEINDEAQATKHTMRCDRRSAKNQRRIEPRVWHEKEWKGWLWPRWAKWDAHIGTNVFNKAFLLRNPFKCYTWKRRGVWGLHS